MSPKRPFNPQDFSPLEHAAADGLGILEVLNQQCQGDFLRALFVLSVLLETMHFGLPADFRQEFEAWMRALLAKLYEKAPAVPDADGKVRTTIEFRHPTKGSAFMPVELTVAEPKK